MKDSIYRTQPSQMAQALLCLQHVLEQCSDIVFITDHTGIITRVNPAFEELTGYPSLDIIGRDLSCFTADGAQSEAYSRIWEHIFAGKAFRGPLVFQSQAGENCKLEVKITPLRDKRGVVTTLIGTGQELRPSDNTNSPSSGGPGIRSSSSRIMHELNNLLTIMGANAELALAALTSEHPAWRNLQDIRNASRRTSALGRQFLDAEREPAQAFAVPSIDSMVSKTSGQLPVVPAEPRVMPAERRPPVSYAGESRQTLLIVDDEALIREATAEFLSKTGYKVLSAGSGEEALEMVKSHPAIIQLVITDIVLPQMSGSQLASSLASIQPSIKVVLISGYSESAVLHKNPPAPGIHFLQKPFSLHVLAGKVEEILGATKRAKAATGAAG